MGAERGVMRETAGAARMRGREGFTLVEALASFAILAMLTLFVQRGVVMAKTGLLRADDRIAAERVAETLLAEPFADQSTAGGSRAGTADGYRWVVRTEPLDLPPAGGSAASAATGAAVASSAAGAPSAAGKPPPGSSAQGGGKQARWRAMRVTIQVMTARGRMLEVETVRLAKVD